VGIATEVTWTNNDTIVHRIVANDQSFDSGDLEPGSSYSVIITQVGTYSYYCSDDSEIAAVIKVIDPSTSSN
jgi:plastocyanin